jgi:threonine synthase
MNYFSTRGTIKNLSFKDAVMMGMAEDGGLLLPESYPQIDISALRGLSYTQTAYEVLKGFATDIPADKLRSLIDNSYVQFPSNPIPVVDVKECKLAELFHGPTLAFKDVALQLLGNLFEYILAERKERMNIVGATSGDTGSAAIAGVRGKQNINIAILYPDGRVSVVQEAQMASIPDANVYTYAVDGTFDDCQRIVKELFADVAFKKAHALGAVNSINWARIMSQIVYYFYSYIQANIQGKVNFVVPTGNFGNIFAAYAAKQMGLPIDKLVIATNENDILHRFVGFKDYSLRQAVPTHSPSMDIHISSNLERFLYYLYNDSNKLNSAMAQLKETGKIDFSAQEWDNVKATFDSYAVSNASTEAAIKRVHAECGYVMDPHTACAVEAAHQLKLDPKCTIAMATAHPAKFPDLVKAALGFEPEQPESVKKLANLPLRCKKAKNSVEEFRKILEAIDK